MKIAIFSTISDPKKWQYNFEASLDCYEYFADSVVVVDGSLEEDLGYIEARPKVRRIQYPWPYEWHWRELPLHINRGFESIPGDTDIAIKMDSDYLFHETSRDGLIGYLEMMIQQNKLLGTLEKITVIDQSWGFAKAKIPVVVNMHHPLSRKIAFGRDNKDETDWCFPIIKESQDAYGLWTGTKVEADMRIPIHVFNYDYYFKDLPISRIAFARFARAYKRALPDKPGFGNTDLDAYEVMEERFAGFNNRKFQIQVDHPFFIKEDVINIDQRKRGYSNWS